MKYVLDTHTHTFASGHSYSTIREMAYTAKERGLKLLGITEHAPKMPGSCHEFYFQNLKVVDRVMCGVELLLGAELNIMDSNGTVDLPDSILRKLDITIASLHIPCMTPGTLAENTNAYINAMKNPYVNIIGHPDDGRYPIDYPALVQAAKEYGKVLELNNHSLSGECLRKGAYENDRCMLELCKEYQVPVIMGSDAHFDTRIAKFSHAIALLEEVDFPQELVLNRSLEAIGGHINRKLNGI